MDSYDPNTIPPTPPAPPAQVPSAPQPQPWTGGQKAGWFFVGMLAGIPGVLIASLANVNHPDRSTATKMALIGMAAWIVVLIVIFFMAACTTSMLVSGIAASAAYY